jgi:hypothetical protein
MFPFDVYDQYSLTRSRNRDPSVSMSFLGLSYSTNLPGNVYTSLVWTMCNGTICQYAPGNGRNIPSLIASTISQSITVGIRWATVITVQCLNSVRIVFWRTTSVALSIEAVASSRTKIRHLLRSARPKQKSCLWPMLQFDPSSATALQSWLVLWTRQFQTSC